MKYGLATMKDGVIFTSRSLDIILEQMSVHPDSYIVEIEEKKDKKRNFSEEFYESRLFNRRFMGFWKIME